jgi:prepilin-type N-terminal cleavage/methylation domain-containing protein
VKTNFLTFCRGAKKSKHSGAAKGFTLIELLVAMAVFVVVAGTAFTLFGKHEAYAIRQEGLSGVDIGLRNAIAQMQMDLSSAGQNLLLGAPGATPFSLGVIVENNVPGVAAACTPNANTYAYPVPSACFDGLMIISSKPCTAAGGQYAPVLALTANVNNINTLTTTSVTDNNAGANMANDASCFQAGDEVLIVEQNTQNPPYCTGVVQSPYCMTVVSLSSNAAYVSATSSITLTFNPPGANGVPAGCPGASCNDPLGIVYQAYAGGGTNYLNLLTANFALGAYVVDLGSGSNDISYAVQVNPSDATDPQLIRCGTQLALCTAGAGQVLADQVIGFKIGAALWDSADQEDIASYFYNAANYCNGSVPVGAPTDCTATPPPSNDPEDYSLVRSIRVSMIGRTKPEADQTLNQFKNGFDNGPYLVQQASVAVDIRNMSNVDFGN